MKNLIMYFVVAVALLTTLPAASEHSSASTGRREKKTPLSNYSNSIIIRWNQVAFETMQGPTYNPMIASRVMAMVHIAMHDALNNIAPVYETYAYHKLDKKADPIVAASVAAYTVLSGSFPDKKESLDLALKNVIKEIAEGSEKQRGHELGLQAGRAILSLRADDHAFDNPIAQVTNPDEPGLYQPVPPTPIIFAPFWAKLPTFGLSSPQQFRVGAMPALASSEYAVAYNEVKAKGAKDNSTRTSEETTIAKFWYEFSEIGWNRITMVAAQDAKLDLLATARLSALVNIALADSYIAGWDSKMFYNFWRPYTAIRKGATDTNTETKEDSSWEPLMATPPIHDYPSTHSVLGSAAATILGHVLGDNVGFTMTSTTSEEPNHKRTFKSFSQAALENADSRVFAGLHFRFSCDTGLALGRQIGDWTFANKLKKVKGAVNP